MTPGQSSNRSESSPLEVRPLRTPAQRYDVAIVGGGLAGLTLAIQLKRERPQTTVLVLEKREGPAPQAAFKVGESTVPSGAHYFAEVVGMREHLERDHLKKMGLRFFMPTATNGDITQRPELGGPVYPPHDNYQIDRGVFENELAARARLMGVSLHQACVVQSITLGDAIHTVDFRQFDTPRTTEARWVVDASGRASVLKRQLGVAQEVPHTANASWIRLGGGLDFEQWGAHDAEWMARVREPGQRQYSTNHLLGDGYWVWLIPLATGPISIGVCTDPRVHPFEEVSEFDAMLAWLGRHEPQLADAIAPRVDEVQDFLRVEDFAYGVERTYSRERWALVGEAAAFADAFYSPGSDMIGYGNIHTGDLIKRDLAGEDIDARVDYYNDFYQRTFAHVLSRTQGTYPMFGNALVSMGYLTWGGYMSHIGTVLLTVQNKLTDLEFMRSVDADLDRLYRLNMNMMDLFRQRHELDSRLLEPLHGRPYGAQPQSLFDLVTPFSDDELRDRLRHQVRTCEAAAVSIFHRAGRALGDNAPDPASRVNPYVVGMQPDQWHADGLFDDTGLTLAEADETIGDLSNSWPEDRTLMPS